MARIEVTTSNPDHPKHTVTLEPGERISLCRCWHSQKFPLCDGSHKQHPGQGPCVIAIEVVSAPKPEEPA